MRPEARSTTEYVRDTASQNLRQKELHTTSINDYYTATTWDADRAVSGTTGFTPSGTAPLRITRMNVMALNVEYFQLSIADRNGTIDTIGVGTAVATNKKVQKIFNGGPENPLYIIDGTFAAYNTSGSVASGTMAFSFEGVRSPPEI